MTSDSKKVFLGTLGKPKGLKGHIRLHLFNPDTDLLQAGLVFCMEGEASAEFVVDTCKPYPKSHLLTIKNHLDINLIEPFKGKKIFVYREQLQDLAAGEYYHVDLVGCAVVDTGGAPIGQVQEVLATGANDILVVVAGDGGEVLIPFIDPYVKDVDMDHKTITAVVPEVAT